MPKNNIQEIVGVIVAILLLAVIIPALSQALPNVGQTFSFFNLLIPLIILLILLRLLKEVFNL